MTESIDVFDVLGKKLRNISIQRTVHAGQSCFAIYESKIAQLSTARDRQNVVRSTSETANSSLVVRVILFL